MNLPPRVRLKSDQTGSEGQQESPGKHLHLETGTVDALERAERARRLKRRVEKRLMEHWEDGEAMGTFVIKMGGTEERM